MSAAHTVEPELLVATFHTDGTVRFRNRPWVRLLGERSDPFARLEQHDAQALRTRVSEASQGSLITHELILVPGIDAEAPRPLLLHLIPVQGPAGEIQAISVTGELLEQPESWTEGQTERHRMETLGRMTMGIAHDFNNLLSGILGHSELMRSELEEEADMEAIEEHARTIEQAAHDGAALIRKIQRYIREEQAASFEPLDLTSLIQDCVVLTRPYWYNEPRRKGIAIAVEQQLDALPTVAGSAAELRDVFVNLILNAVQAMPEGGMITIKSWTDNGSACVSFTDTGVGMSEAVRERIFEPLFTTKGEQGTGMGLSVASGVVQEHGGSLTVISKLGHGSTFTLRLPPASDMEVDPAPPPRAAPSGSHRILVVDDEPMVRSVLIRLLELRGHQVVGAPSGTAALEELERATFDLVITDHGMPNMSGRELAASIRMSHSRLPVILLTGDTHVGESDANVSAVLAKPFKIDDVQETIDELI